MSEFKREHLSSRIGFIFLSAGCAIGCGNVWKFPWMVGQYGGGAFVLLYLVCLVVLGLPVMIMEFAMGRGAQKSPVKMYQELEPKGSKWHYHGYLCFFGNIALMSFYTVVTGWMINYFVKYLIGKNDNLSFVSMITNPYENVFYLAVTVIVSFFILCFNMQKGLEKVSKNLLLCLFFLMIVLVGNSLSMSGAASGLKFYLMPNFSKINGSVLVSAMNQAFFTLSTGIGAMAIFGSYIGKERSLMGESINVIVLDTLVAIMSGLIIFPACTTYNISVTAGPALLFETMTQVFNKLSYGRLWGTLFFLFMVFAAFSTVIAVCENIIACFREITNWSRVKASIISGAMIFALALTTALGYSKLHFQPFASGTAWLDFWDFIVSVNLLPIGSILFALFCSYKIGWGWDKFVLEANTGSGAKVKEWMKPVFKYIVPALVIVIYIYGLVTFQWK